MGVYKKFQKKIISDFAHAVPTLVVALSIYYGFARRVSLAPGGSENGVGS